MGILLTDLNGQNIAVFRRELWTIRYLKGGGGGDFFCLLFFPSQKLYRIFFRKHELAQFFSHDIFIIQ